MIYDHISIYPYCKSVSLNLPKQYSEVLLNASSSLPGASCPLSNNRCGAATTRLDSLDPLFIQLDD